MKKISILRGKVRPINGKVLHTFRAVNQGGGLAGTNRLWAVSQERQAPDRKDAGELSPAHGYPRHHRFSAGRDGQILFEKPNWRRAPDDPYATRKRGVLRQVRQEYAETAHGFFVVEIPLPNSPLIFLNS
jgi:hypothetical protein